MGLGMGGTMMPIMTSALQTLKDAEIARGSTLMNITQQVAASIGTALFSVLLTNGFNGSDALGQLIVARETGAPARPADHPAGVQRHVRGVQRGVPRGDGPGRAVHPAVAAAAAPASRPTPRPTASR